MKTLSFYLISVIASCALLVGCEGGTFSNGNFYFSDSPAPFSFPVYIGLSETDDIQVMTINAGPDCYQANITLSPGNNRVTLGNEQQGVFFVLSDDATSMKAQTLRFLSMVETRSEITFVAEARTDYHVELCVKDSQSPSVIFKKAEVVGPLADTALYLLTNINNWRPILPMAYVGEDTYQTVVDLSLSSDVLSANGYYEFIISDAKYTLNNTYAPMGSTPSTLVLNEKTPLWTGSAKKEKLKLIIAKQGRYLFKLKLSSLPSIGELKVSYVGDSIIPLENSLKLKVGDSDQFDMVFDTSSNCFTTEAVLYVGANQVSVSNAEEDSFYKIATSSGAYLYDGISYEATAIDFQVPFSAYARDSRVFDFFMCQNDDDSFQFRYQTDDLGLYFPTQLYVRGNFNSWSLDDPLIYKGDQIYQATILLGSSTDMESESFGTGFYEFKIADQNYTSEFTFSNEGDEQTLIDVGVAEVFEPAKGTDNNTGFQAENQGYYTFTLKADLKYQELPDFILSYEQDVED